jgi:peptidyl-prolyl cis-trans isomerase C
MAARERIRIKSAAQAARPVLRRGLAPAFMGALGLFGLSAAGLAQSGATAVEPLPLNLPEIEAGKAALPPDGPETARLRDALKQMEVENPVVARVNGHEIRWAEVLASAGDLPPRYRSQIESVFPALLDRLVDLRLIADAAREQGLGSDPVVRERLAAYEDRVLSGVLLERYLEDQVTTAQLRQRYDALVSARRRDSEVRARHILVEEREVAEQIIAQLDSGAVFISLATEYSTGPSAQRGGDLGYFLPSRMDPDFAEAVLALEPGQYTRAPVKTEFGWHVVLLVDRRSDSIPSFLDMQPRLREEARKEAVDRLVFGLRNQADLQMFPQDSAAGDAAEADAASAPGGGAQ